MRERVERMAADLDLVTSRGIRRRPAATANARTSQDELAAKVATLEAELASLRHRCKAGVTKPRRVRNPGGSGKPENT